MSTTKQQQDNILTGDHKGEVKQLVSTIAPTIPSHIANPVLGNKPQPVSFRSEFQLLFVAIRGFYIIAFKLVLCKNTVTLTQSSSSEFAGSRVESDQGAMWFISENSFKCSTDCSYWGTHAYRSQTSRRFIKLNNEILIKLYLNWTFHFDVQILLVWLAPGSFGFLLKAQTISPSEYTMQKEREARRTVYVDNLDPFLTAEHILNYFQFCGDIRYLRIGGDWMEKKRYTHSPAPFFVKFLI